MNGDCNKTTRSRPIMFHVCFVLFIAERVLTGSYGFLRVLAGSDRFLRLVTAQRADVQTPMQHSTQRSRQSAPIGARSETLRKLRSCDY